MLLESTKKNDDPDPINFIYIEVQAVPVQFRSFVDDFQHDSFGRTDSTVCVILLTVQESEDPNWVCTDIIVLKH